MTSQTLAAFLIGSRSYLLYDGPDTPIPLKPMLLLHNVNAVMSIVASNLPFLLRKELDDYPRKRNIPENCMDRDWVVIELLRLAIEKRDQKF